MKKICKRVVALLLGIMMLSNALLVNAAEQYSDKIDADLQEVMEKATEEEIILEPEDGGTNEKGLDEGRKLAICEDYLTYLNSSYWTLEDIIIEYYGTYSGCEIVWMSCKDLADTADIGYLPIGNFMFECWSGSAVERFYVYKEHEFIPVRNAYEQGLITDDDVEELAKQFGKMAYRIKWNFEDVAVDDWFCEGVHFCAQNGIMVGVDDEHFEPGRTITRAEFVAALYRLAGKPQVTEDNAFTDVPEGSYYEDAVSWCTEKKIVFGTTKETFSPNLPITREEIACLVARYAIFVGAKFLYDDIEAELGYRDFDKVSAYAKEGVDLVRREGLMVGDHNGMFNPQNPATRAEVALIFKKLVQYMDTDRGQWSKYNVNDYKGKGTVQTYFFESETTAKLRKLLDIDEKGWKEVPVPEYISKYELVLDDVIYHFESLDADPTLPIRCEEVYGGKCYGMVNSDGALLAQVYELLPSE